MAVSGRKYGSTLTHGILWCWPQETLVVNGRKIYVPGLRRARDGHSKQCPCFHSRGRRENTNWSYYIAQMCHIIESLVNHNRMLMIK